MDHSVIPPVAFVHDHLVQGGGAERVLLSMVKAFPDAPLYTSFYRPEATYREFQEVDVRPSRFDRIGVLRRHHRSALPLMPSLFSRLSVRADVVVCGSAGWAQGTRVEGRKIVYFHALAAWLHAPEYYLSRRGIASRIGLSIMRRYLTAWDKKTGPDAHRHLVYGPTMQRRARAAYGVEAQVLTPPMALDPAGPQRPFPDLEPGFYLCVARLLPYKNVDAIIGAFATLRGERLVIAGDGPDARRLRRMAPDNVIFLGGVDDSGIRWLYARCAAVVCAGYEAYGLVPVEAAAFGRPTVSLGQAGLLDTVIEDATGLTFARPEPDLIADAVRRLQKVDVDRSRLQALADEHSQATFVARLRAIVEEERRALA